MRGEAVQDRTRRVLPKPAGLAASDLVWLKPGDESTALFLFPGAGADVFELKPLAQRLASRRAVACLQFTAANQDVSVDAIVDRALAAITQVQPRGALHLFGYSYGGAIAVEAARRLHAQGREVALLVLVEAVYDASYWPFGIRAATRLQWAIRRLAELKGAPFGLAVAQLRRRAGALFARTARRFVGAAHQTQTVRDAALSGYIAAMARFRPRAYPGAAVFFTGERGDHCCNPPALWRGLIGRLEVERIPGSHLGIVRSPASVERLAAGIDARLGDPADEAYGRPA